MSKGKLLHEGKSKVVFEDTTSSDHVIIEFKDDVTAGDGTKKDTLTGKGNVCADLSEYLFKYLESKGIQTHFVERIDDTLLRCLRVDIYGVEVVCRNTAAGSFCRRYGIEKGKEIQPPLLELFVKDDKLHDPLITSEAAQRLGLVKRDEIGFMMSITSSANYYISELLKQVALSLVDFKLEFGRTPDGRILLADEISGDTVRVWDNRMKSLDKDLFRNDEGSLVSAYNQLLKRLRETNPTRVTQRSERLSVCVLPKDGIKNPPGEVTRSALLRLGFDTAHDVRVGRAYDITLGRPITHEILEQLEAMNLKLLSNPIVEKHQVRLDS